jgi:hypothetical protein
MLHLLLALLAPEVANDQLRSQHTQVTKDVQKQLLILDHHKVQNTAAVDNDDGSSFFPTPLPTPTFTKNTKVLSRTKTPRKNKPKNEPTNRFLQTLLPVKRTRD